MAKIIIAPPESLEPFDLEREASMADEGGISGALMETEDVPLPRDLELGEFMENESKRAPVRVTNTSRFAFGALFSGLLALSIGLGLSLAVRKLRS
jgi:hypothetical protein